MSLQAVNMSEFKKIYPCCKMGFAKEQPSEKDGIYCYYSYSPMQDKKSLDNTNPVSHFWHINESVLSEEMVQLLYF